MLGTMLKTLGLDTSNYTTSAAWYEAGSVVQKKQLLPVREGEKGLRQSDAVFHHVRQLPQVVGALLEEHASPDCIGVSVSPRNVPESYMPCFLVGANTAAVLGAALRIPVEHFSHQQGHIAAALYSAGALELLGKPFLAFHVSGGTTEALLCTPGEHCIPLPECKAHSLDLKAGQAVDRVGLLLGLRFPCGPELERLALLAESEAAAYRPVLKGNDCSLSGIENKCAQLLHRGAGREEVAAFCIGAIAAVLDAMCEGLLRELGSLPVVFSGGVCANTMIKKRLSEKYNALFAAPAFSADNAAGPAILAQIKREGL